VEDDKVSTDDLEEKIVAFEDYVRLSLLLLTMKIRFYYVFKFMVLIEPPR